jgi:hypothetical protein
MKRFLFIIAIFLAMAPSFGQTNIVAGEYFFDTDPGTGLGTPVSIVSPSTKDSLTLSVSVNALALGNHILNFRFIDAAGHWGLTYSRNFYIFPPIPALSNIVSGEYYFDNDPDLVWLHL